MGYKYTFVKVGYIGVIGAQIYNWVIKVYEVIGARIYICKGCTLGLNEVIEVHEEIEIDRLDEVIYATTVAVS